MLRTMFSLTIKKIKLKNIHALKISSASKRFVSVQSLVVPKPSNYRFYDSAAYQPKALKCWTNTWKPVFIKKTNRFGDLPEVLIKNSNWFLYWQPLFKYWKKKNFVFKSRDVSNLQIYGTGCIDFASYVQLPLGISYSPFWMGFLILGLNSPEYRWLTIFVEDENQLSDAILKKLFNTTNVFIMVSKHSFYRGMSDCVILVRSSEFKLKLLEFSFYGFKCRLTDFFHFDDSLTIFRDSKKKWVWLNAEVGDFIYYIHSEKKRMVFYQHIGGIIKKIGKTKFDFLKQSLPVKQKKNSVFENV